MKRLALIFVLVACLASACSGPSKPYAAEVDGVTIPVSVVEKEIATVAGNPQAAAGISSELQSVGGIRPGGPNTVSTGYSSQVVYTRILAILFQREIDRQGIKLTQTDRDKAAQEVRSSQEPGVFDSFDPAYRAYITERQANLDALVARRTSDTALRAYYDAHVADYQQTCLRHVALGSRAEADAIHAQILSGGDFAKLANDNSIDSPTQQGQPPNGGDLGCVQQAQLANLPPVVTTVINALPVGGTSDVLQIQDQYYVLQVTARRQPSFDESRDNITKTYATPTVIFKELLDKAKIKVNPRFGTYTPASPNDTNPGNVLPSTPYALTPDPTPNAASSTDQSNLLGGS